MAEYLKNGREYTMIDIQVGGAGASNWQVLDIQGEMTAPSGGGQGGDSMWGRTQDGRGAEFIGTMRTGNPARHTGQVAFPLTAENYLRSLQQQNCEYDLRKRQKCDDARVMSNYKQLDAFISTVLDSLTYGEAIADATEGVDNFVKQQINYNAGLYERWVKVRHLDISGTHSDYAINKVRQLAGQRCAGNCGVALTGEEQFGVVTDKDASAGYAGNPTAKYGFTADGGATWTWSWINVYQGVDATDFISFGDYVIAFSPSRAPAYALWQDLIDQVTDAWTLASGITANFPGVAEMTPNGVIFAAGAGGYIYKSTDGGLAWTSVSAAAATTEDVLSIAFASDTLGWFGCGNGVLLKYTNGVLSIVEVQSDTIGTIVVTANLNVVRVPPGRSNQLYIGTSGGEIWACVNTTAQTPVFVERTFGDSGVGSIDDIQFTGGYRGSIMYVIQTDGNNLSRVLRDLSGGVMGVDVDLVGNYTSPANFGMNSIAPANANFAMTVGEVHVTYAFIGSIQSV